ncbi:MAG: hypothetical protein MEQ07_03560 [Aquimonas sp.]|nr:hypothetical protein [Aquimonas sp.]
MLKRLFSALSRLSADNDRGVHSRGSAVAVLSEFPPVPMQWFDDTRLPLPDWELMEAGRPAGLEPAALDAWWTAAAGHWLLAMAEALDAGAE